MQANEWWSKIRAAEREAREGNPQKLHDLCEELEQLTEPPPVPVAPEKLHAVTPEVPAVDLTPIIFG